MRVLKIIHTMGHGGAENVFRWLAWGLKKEGIDVLAGIPLNNDPRKKENWITPALEELGIPYTTFDRTGSAGHLFGSLYSLIRRTKPDIVHSHLLDSNFYSSIACKCLSIPHACTEHGDVALKNNFFSKVKFALISVFSDSIICVSEAVRKKAASTAIRSSKLSSIYNGIIFPDEGPSTFRDEMGISSKTLLIGNVGNLYPIKGQRFLIRAFSRVLERFPDACLVIVGRGNEENRLKNESCELGIPEGRVIFTGFRKDVGNILRSLDLYVQPSLSEGHPVSILEAMSLGVPVIATRVGGVPEVLGNNTHGLLVPPESWEDLYKCMIDVALDMETFRQKATAAKRFVREKFSLQKMTREYLELYKKVVRIRHHFIP